MLDITGDGLVKSVKYKEDKDLDTNYKEPVRGDVFDRIVEDMEELLGRSGAEDVSVTVSTKRNRVITLSIQQFEAPMT